jgi:hypothetical protein
MTLRTLPARPTLDQEPAACPRYTTGVPIVEPQPPGIM